MQHHSARVRSTDSLERLQIALGAFAEDGTHALEAVSGEILRVFQWLEEQLSTWQHELQRAKEKVYLANEELARKRMLRVGGRPIDIAEQEKDLIRAKRRLEYVREKEALTRRWIRDLPSELLEYEAPARNLQNLLETHVPKARAILKAKIRALREYLALKPPEKSPTHAPTTTTGEETQ
ncbi:MAG: hypothetical protein ACFCD0_16515 [Gemmataceae bacterium]